MLTPPMVAVGLGLLFAICTAVICIVSINLDTPQFLLFLLPVALLIIFAAAAYADKMDEPSLVQCQQFSEVSGYEYKHVGHTCYINRPDTGWEILR